MSPGGTPEQQPGVQLAMDEAPARLVEELRHSFPRLRVLTDLAELAAATDADLLLVDLQRWDPMRELLSLRRAERSEDRLPLPIVGFSGSLDPEERMRALEAACTAYIGAPDERALLAAARSCLESRHQARVPRELADLAPDYLANRWDDARELERSVWKGDFALIRQIGHSMRGSGASYGFAVISVVGRMLEHAADRRDVQLARCWNAKLRAYLAQVEIVPAYETFAPTMRSR